MGEDKAQLRSGVAVKKSSLAYQPESQLLAGVLVILGIATIILPLVFCRLPLENVPVPM